ncbi:hypothetical protein EZ138_20265, partial [Shigella flexneri]|nr:hypothetical protein [Shigella flexneri]
QGIGIHRLTEIQNLLLLSSVGRLLFRIEVFMKAITLEQFAAMANVSTRTLRRWLKKPSTGVPLPFTPRGTRQLFWEHECKEWLYRTER